MRGLEDFTWDGSSENEEKYKKKKFVLTIGIFRVRAWKVGVSNLIPVAGHSSATTPST